MLVTKNQQKIFRMISLISLGFIWSQALLDFYKYFDLMYLGSCYFIESSLSAREGDNFAASCHLPHVYS